MAKNKDKALIIIDMQNDFITGSLKNPNAEEIIPGIINEIKSNKYVSIVTTQDTHDSSYLKTPEGIQLPIKHCIQNTPGWCIQDDIFNALEQVKENEDTRVDNILKNTFGYRSWDSSFIYIQSKDIKEIVLVGTCTDICVVANALLLKTHFPEKIITVKADLCAGTTPENHRMALEVMKSCQVEVE